MLRRMLCFNGLTRLKTVGRRWPRVSDTSHKQIGARAIATVISQDIAMPRLRLFAVDSDFNGVARRGEVGLTAPARPC
jgi:hypothetical protein